jgi:predicted ATPase
VKISSNLRRNNPDSLSSDVDSLRNGIIKTSKNQAKVSYTIFLVGETGVGKSSVFELIANVLAGNNIDNYDPHILDRANERGGSNNQSQTNSARFYELKSKNGIVVSSLPLRT